MTDFVGEAVTVGSGGTTNDDAAGRLTRVRHGNSDVTVDWAANATTATDDADHTHTYTL